MPYVKSLILSMFLPLCQNAGAQTAEAFPEQSVAVYVGRTTTNAFTHHFIKPWSLDFAPSNLAAVAYSRHLATLWPDHLELEGEVYGDIRWGEDDVWEAGAALTFRWTKFPWNETVKTSFAISTLGISYTSKIPAQEDRNFIGNGSKLLHVFSPEITFADPDNPQLEGLVRLHHRSGVFGAINGVYGGSNVLSVGVRYRF
jgi:hypothetical protein